MAGELLLTIVLQGKTYTTDPITHKRVVNMGEGNKYYIKDSKVIKDKRRFTK